MSWDTASETEQRAALVADALAAVDRSAEDARKLTARAAPVRVQVEAPGDGPTAADRRQWAIQDALRRNPLVLRPGEPRVDAVFAVDGGARVVRNIPRPKPLEVIGPDQWEAHEARWEFRQRWQENELLARTYGLEQCVREGIISKTDADLLRLHPECIRPVPQLRGLEGL